MNELKYIQKEAIDLAKIWVKFVKNAKNSVWSKQQKEFINDIMDNSKNSLLTKEIYLKARNKLDKLHILKQ